jgi:hypothetical protein
VGRVPGQAGPTPCLAWRCCSAGRPPRPWPPRRCSRRLGAVGTGPTLNRRVVFGHAARLGATGPARPALPGQVAQRCRLSRLTPCRLTARSRRRCENAISRRTQTLPSAIPPPVKRGCCCTRGDRESERGFGGSGFVGGAGDRGRLTSATQVDRRRGSSSARLSQHTGGSRLGRAPELARLARVRCLFRSGGSHVASSLLVE